MAMSRRQLRAEKQQQLVAQPAAGASASLVNSAPGSPSSSASVPATAATETIAEIPETQIEYVDVNDLRRGSYVLLRDQHCCRVVELTRSGTGKHGGAKVHLIALDVFTGRRFEDAIGSTKRVSCPEVRKFDAELLHVEFDRSSVLLRSKDGSVLHRVPLPVAIAVTEEGEVRLPHDADQSDAELTQRLLSAHRSQLGVYCQVLQTTGRQRIVAVRPK